MPASVRHEAPKEQGGLARYSFFVYGGVNIQPKINFVKIDLPMSGKRESFSNVNAQVAMNRKMSALESAQKLAVKTVNVGDGRIRYYEAERPSKTPGPTRGAAYVTEYNSKTGRVRSWNECYAHNGKVNRMHPKMLDGQDLVGPHYPPTKADVNK